MKPTIGSLTQNGAQAQLHGAAAVMALAGGVYFIGGFLYIAISRIGYPFALEWWEAGSYTQVQRLLSGQPLYTRPTMEYVAMIYPPLYYYAAAIVSRIIGFAYLPLRLVSFASSLGTLVVIFLIVKHEGDRIVPAVLASAMFAATYFVAGSWFDIARVDMLSVFLVLLAIGLLRLKAMAWHVTAALVFALACLTKQTHLITLASLVVYLAVLEPRKLLTFVAPCLALLGAAYLLLNSVYDGWFGFFVLKLALGSGEYVTFESAMFAETALDFWLNSIVRALPLVVLIILACVVMAIQQRQERLRLFFYLACAVGMVGTSWSVVQVGGYKNDLVPAYAALAVLFGVSLQWLMARAARLPLGASALLTACVVQFALLWYPLAPELPTQADLLAGNSLLQRIRNQEGDVYVPFHPDLALMAGKEPFASWSPIYQLEGSYGGGDVRTAGRVKTEFARAMQRRQFSMIILDQEPNWIWGDPEQYYSRSAQPVFSSQDVFWPVTGWQTRPEIILLPAAD